MADNGAMSAGRGPDDERPVDLSDDDLEILPDQTSDDTDTGWGEWRGGAGDDDARFLEERPPHW
jgi:hypothetical protein